MEGYQHLKAQPLILRHISTFSFPSNGINNIGKGKSLQSLFMVFFSLWELKSEAQTLNPISFPRTFVSGASPCHLKSGPSLIIQGQKPSPWCHSDHPGAFSFLWGLNWLFHFFTLWQDSDLESAPPQPHPAVRCGGRRPIRYTSQSFCSSFSDSWSLKEPILSRVVVCSQPTGICKTNLKEFVFHLSNPYPYMLWIL